MTKLRMLVTFLYPEVQILEDLSQTYSKTQMRLK